MLQEIQPEHFLPFAAIKGIVRHMTVVTTVTQTGHMALNRDIFSIIKYPQGCEVSALAHSHNPHCLRCISGQDERHKWVSHFSFLEVCGVWRDH